MLKYIIMGLIIIYFIYVIYKKFNDMKNGKFCDCGCGDCPIKDKCNSLQNDDK